MEVKLANEVSLLIEHDDSLEDFEQRNQLSPADDVSALLFDTAKMLAKESEDCKTMIESLRDEIKQMESAPKPSTTEVAAASVDAEVKALREDFCSVLRSLQDTTTSAGEKQQLIHAALLRFKVS